MDILGYIIFSLWFISIIFAFWYIYTYAWGKGRRYTYRRRRGPNYLTMLQGKIEIWLSTSANRPRPEKQSFFAKKFVNPSTKQKLLTMLQGDELAAERLISHTKGSNPGRSEQWCWEKAIWDLERDRRI